MFKEIKINQILTLAILSIASVGRVCNAVVSVGIDHDLTQPTYGLEGKTSSSIKYDNQNGLNMAGTIADLLGPPIKIANGFNNMVKGNNMASVGTGLKSGGALLGFDAKVFETAGAGNLFKGGLLLNAAQAKVNASGQLAGPKGQKIASIIEVPVKVVAVKDLAAGQALTGLGNFKSAGASQLTNKGQTLVGQGQALKTQGLNQMIQGANEGFQNLGNMFQKQADNVNTAFKLFPLVWDIKQQQVAQQHEEAAKGQQVQQVQQQQLVSTPYQMSPPTSPLTGGSLFGGLSSLIPGLSSSALSGNGAYGSGPNSGYAALWNTTSPLTNLLMSPGVNPFLLPLTSGPLGQAVALKQPIGTPEASNAAGLLGGNAGKGLLQQGQASQSYNFNLIPGLSYKETVSAALPTMGLHKQSGAPRERESAQSPVRA